MSWDPQPRPVATLALSLAASTRASGTPSPVDPGMPSRFRPALRDSPASAGVRQRLRPREPSAELARRVGGVGAEHRAQPLLGQAAAPQRRPRPPRRLERRPLPLGGALGQREPGPPHQPGAVGRRRPRCRPPAPPRAGRGGRPPAPCRGPSPQRRPRPRSWPATTAACSWPPSWLVSPVPTGPRPPASPGDAPAPGGRRPRARARRARPRACGARAGRPGPRRLGRTCSPPSAPRAPPRPPRRARGTPRAGARTRGGTGRRRGRSRASGAPPAGRSRRSACRTPDASARAPGPRRDDRGASLDPHPPVTERTGPRASSGTLSGMAVAPPRWPFFPWSRKQAYASGGAAASD